MRVKSKKVEAKIVEWKKVEAEVEVMMIWPRVAVTIVGPWQLEASGDHARDTKEVARYQGSLDRKVESALKVKTAELIDMSTVGILVGLTRMNSY